MNIEELDEVIQTHGQPKAFEVRIRTESGNVKIDTRAYRGILLRVESKLNYSGRTGKVTASIDKPHADCWYCKTVWGQGEKADVKKYIRSGLGDRL